MTEDKKYRFKIEMDITADKLRVIRKFLDNFSTSSLFDCGRHISTKYYSALETEITHHGRDSLDVKLHYKTTCDGEDINDLDFTHEFFEEEEDEKRERTGWDRWKKRSDGTNPMLDDIE